MKNQLHFVGRGDIFFLACCHVIFTCIIWLSVVSVRTINNLNPTLCFLKKLDIPFRECECITLLDYEYLEYWKIMASFGFLQMKFALLELLAL